MVLRTKELMDFLCLLLLFRMGTLEIMKLDLLVLSI
jgi:hypothetical protein